MALMSVSEVITAAYTRKIDSTQLKTSDIEIAEFQYIRPVLTENLYNAVVADTTTYATLISTYIKPCLAYYVKYLTFEGFYTEVSDRGLNHLISQDGQTVSNAARTDAKAEILKKAQILEEKLLDYVVQQYMTGNTDYTLYRDSTNVFNEKKFIGGFLADSEPIEDRYRSQYRRFE